jgi:hypothetical protein
LSATSMDRPCIQRPLPRTCTQAGHTPCQCKSNAGRKRPGALFNLFNRTWRHTGACWMGPDTTQQHKPAETHNKAAHRPHTAAHTSANLPLTSACGSVMRPHPAHQGGQRYEATPGTPGRAARLPPCGTAASLGTHVPVCVQSAKHTPPPTRLCHVGTVMVLHPAPDVLEAVQSFQQGPPLCT